MSKRRLIPTAISAFFLLAGFIWLGANFREIRAAYPRPTDITLAGYLRNRGTPQRAQLLKKGDRATIVCIGGIPNGFMPSGPAVYIFDDAGRIIDYTVDSGDDPDFQRHWPDFWNGGETLTEAALRKTANAP